MKTYYKAICRYAKNENLSYNTSCSSIYDTSCANRVAYPQNVWVDAPDNTLLFIFDTYFNATRFVNDHRLIKECYAKGARPAPMFGTIEERHYKRYWEVVNSARKAKKSLDAAINKSSNYLNKFEYEWPAGTLWCKSVMIIN